MNTKRFFLLSALAASLNPLCHADNAEAVKHAEHCRAHDLFPVEAATLSAVRDGDWSAPATWDAGRCPSTGARVLIPAGLTVTVDDDRSGDQAIAWLRVDGGLHFANDRDTGLKVDTIFIAEEGLLTAGAENARVAADCVAQVIFAKREDRASARAGDPFDLKGGLICFGGLEIFGAEKTPFALGSEGFSQGLSELQFDSPVAGWRIGDRVLVPGLSPSADQDEVREIASISANRRSIKLDRPLEFDHHAPERVSVPVPVGNLTRNVRFESEGDDIHDRGHVMVMHQQTGTRIEGASFVRLGRTRADQTHTRPQLAADGSLIPGSDLNPIGRYALHFHGRTGARRDVAPHVVRGCVITDSPKHGLVNHGAHVLAEGNVSYRVRGSHFFGENGSEIGTFKGNLAVRSEGSGEDLKSRMYSADMGHSGHGFWLQGGGIEVLENYAFGHRDAAYIFHMKPHMLEGGIAVRFLAANLSDPAIADGQVDVDPAEVPIHFAHNAAAACGSGLAVRYHKRTARHGVPSVFESSVFWSNSLHRHSIDLDYTRGITLRDITLIGDLEHARAAGVLSNGESGELICENLRIEGFDTGIVVPRRGANRITGGILCNRRNVFVQEAVEPGRALEVSGVSFVELSGGRGDQFDVVLLGRADWLVKRSRFPARWHADELANLPTMFSRDTITVDGRRLYYHGQAIAARPLVGEDVGNLAAIGAGELFAQHQLAVAGCLAPPDAHPEPRIFGLLGEHRGYDDGPADEPFQLSSARHTRQLSGYVPVIEFQDGRTFSGAATNLREGCNLVPLGHRGRSALVKADTRAPWLELTNRSWEIHPADVEYGFLVEGRLHDGTSPGAKDRKFRYLVDPLPEPVDGVIRVNVPASDLAGNRTSVAITIKVDEKVKPRQANIDDGD